MRDEMGCFTELKWISYTRYDHSPSLHLSTSPPLHLSTPLSSLLLYPSTSPLILNSHIVSDSKLWPQVILVVRTLLVTGLRSELSMDTTTRGSPSFWHSGILSQALCPSLQVTLLLSCSHSLLCYPLAQITSWEWSMWLLKVKAPPLPILLAEIYRSGEVQDVSNLERTPFRFIYPLVYEWPIICYVSDAQTYIICI